MTNQNSEDRRQFDRDLGFQLGQLTEAVSSMKCTMETIPQLIKDMEGRISDRLDKHEGTVSSLDDRVRELEDWRTAQVSAATQLDKDKTKTMAMVSGAASALVAGAIELIKAMSH